MIKLGTRESKRPWLRVVGVARSVELQPRIDLDLAGRAEHLRASTATTASETGISSCAATASAAPRAQARLGVAIRHELEAAAPWMRTRYVRRWLEGYDGKRQGSAFLRVAVHGVRRVRPRVVRGRAVRRRRVHGEPPSARAGDSHRARRAVARHRARCACTTARSRCSRASASARSSRWRRRTRSPRRCSTFDTSWCSRSSPPKRSSSWRRAGVLRPDSSGGPGESGRHPSRLLNSVETGGQS